ncbi:MAG: hypothetical protein AAB036_10835 [Elusimicrobiota bacterium]
MNIFIALMLNSILISEVVASNWKPACTINDKAPVMEEELQITWIQPWNVELSKEANQEFSGFKAMLDDLERIGMRPRRDRITQKNGQNSQNYVKAAGETLEQILNKTDLCRGNLEECKLWITNLNRRQVFSARYFQELENGEFDRIFTQHAGGVAIPMLEFELKVPMEPSPLYQTQELCDETWREGNQICRAAHKKVLVSKTLDGVLERYQGNVMTNMPWGMRIGCNQSSSEFTLTLP